MKVNNFKEQNMSIKEREREIVEEFALFPDWMDKYEYLIELGKSLPAIAEEDKTDENLIKGCQSRVWLKCGVKEGKLWFTADSDAIITKGIISLLIKIYNGETPQEILAAPPEFIKEIGLQENLSPTRANGLASMVERIKWYAMNAI